jgi:hypothetical protein
MSVPDQTIREASAPDGAPPPGPPGEPSLWGELTDMFRGRHGWLSWLVLVGTLAFFVFTVVSVVCFFRAESEREMIAWAGAFGLGLISISFGRLWFWLLMHRNAVSREIKRVELQVARLSSQLKQPR